MVHGSHHVVHRRLKNRDDGSLLLDTPSASGLTAATTAQTNAAATEATLAFNTALDGGNINTNTGVAFSDSPTATITQPASTTTTTSDLPTNTNADESLTSQSAVSGSSSNISMTTVIGACVGALVGCILIILVGLWLYRRGTKPSPRATGRKQVDKERAWDKLEDDNEDKWEGKDGNKHTQMGVVSVGPMEKLTMFKKSPSIRTAYTSAPDPENANLPPIAPFDHPFAQYHPGLAEKLAMEDSNAELSQPRPFLARMEAVTPISWDGDTVGRDSFLSLNSNNAVSPSQAVALSTPQLTSSAPHYWESAEVMHFENNAEEEERGRPEPRKSGNNPFFGARMSVHSTHSRSNSRSQSQSRASSRAASPEPEMPAPPPLAYTREEKGKGREITPPSPRSSTGSGTTTITGVMAGINPFSDPSPTFTMPVVHAPEHSYSGSVGSQDRALQSLIAALGTTAEDVEERLRVASFQPSVVSDVSAYTETDADTLHQSWPVPPSRPQPGQE